MKSTSFSSVCNKIFCTLVNYEEHKSLTEKCPHKKVGDMLLLYRYTSEESDNEFTVNTVTWKDLAQWRIKHETLHVLANSNTPVLYPVRINKIEDNTDLCLYTFTNKNRFFGSTAVLYSGVLETFAEMVKQDFFILFSNIDYCTCLVGASKDELLLLYSILNDIKKETSDDKLLSNMVFYYDKEKAKLVSTPIPSKELLEDYVAKFKDK